MKRGKGDFDAFDIVAYLSQLNARRGSDIANPTTGKATHTDKEGVPGVPGEGVCLAGTTIHRQLNFSYRYCSTPCRVFCIPVCSS